MKATVWHFDMRDPRFREHPLFLDAREKHEWPRWPSDYEQVATVEAPEDEDLNVAEFCFAATNHLDRKEPACVSWVRPSRSTSSGDIVKLENGKAFLCLSFGWQEL